MEFDSCMPWLYLEGEQSESGRGKKSTPTETIISGHVQHALLIIATSGDDKSGLVCI